MTTWHFTFVPPLLGRTDRNSSGQRVALWATLENSGGRGHAPKMPRPPPRCHIAMCVSILGGCDFSAQFGPLQIYSRDGPVMRQNFVLMVLTVRKKKLGVSCDVRDVCRDDNAHCRNSSSSGGSASHTCQCLDAFYQTVNNLCSTYNTIYTAVLLLVVVVVTSVKSKSKKVRLIIYIVYYRDTSNALNAH